MIHLAPAHYKDLKASGLSDETIKGAGIISVPSDQFHTKLGFKDIGIASLMEIPFGDDYSRFKVWYQEGKDGAKYLTRRDTENRLYLPSKTLNVLSDVSVPLYITEGEKKALKACQEGLNCIAITGLWNWKVKGSDDLISDFGKIALQGRKIVIIPDDDWIDNDKNGRAKNLTQAVSRLATALSLKGANVFRKNL